MHFIAFTGLTFEVRNDMSGAKPDVQDKKNNKALPIVFRLVRAGLKKSRVDSGFWLWCGFFFNWNVLRSYGWLSSRGDKSKEKMTPGDSFSLVTWKESNLSLWVHPSTIKLGSWFRSRPGNINPTWPPELVFSGMDFGNSSSGQIWVNSTDPKLFSGRVWVW